MRNSISTIGLIFGIGLILTACAGTPPPPPAVEGEYRPVNINVNINDASNQQPVIPKIFNFKYDGDIVNALDTLRLAQPQIEVLPVQGEPVPLPIHVDLHGTDLANALRAIGEQGGNIADVVWHTSKSHGGQVFIRFLSASAETK